MTQQILYFTSGSVPTEAEKTEIAAIEAVTNPFAVRLANGSMPVVNGISPDGPILQEVSFVAGTPPIEYADVPVFDINDVIPPELADTDAVVSDGVAVTTPVNGTAMTVTPSVAANSITSLQLQNTFAVVGNGALTTNLNGDSRSLTATVSANNITELQTIATIATVASAATAPVKNSEGVDLGAGVITVANRSIVGVAMPATFAGVTNAANVTCNLNGVSRVLTPTVADGVLTEMQTPATVAAVATAASAPVQNSAGAAIGAGTITVANRAITNIRLPATVAGVSNGAEITLDGFTYTFTVAAGVITAITSVEVGEP